MSLSDQSTVTDGEPGSTTPSSAQLVSCASRLFWWLESLQVKSPDSGARSSGDDGGIFDSLEGRVQGDHYSASHFGWAGAKLAELTAEESYLAPALRAGEFTVRHLHGYPAARWMNHYDFNNYALCATIDTLGDTRVPSHWVPALLDARSNRHWTSNWCAMRGAVHLWQSRRKSSLVRRVEASYWLHTVLARQRSGGLFEDHLRRSASAQYHAFTAAVLARLFIVRPTRRLEVALRRACKLAILLVDADGDGLHFGRGQRQVFGFAALIYLLRFAERNLGIDASGPLGRVWRLLLTFQRMDGSFPLTLVDRPDDAHTGWYDYNRLTVYNAFACAWLSEAASLGMRAKVDARSEVAADIPQKLITRVSGLSVAEDSAQTCRLVMAGPAGKYSSECGLAPQQLWFKGFGNVLGYPGGPSVHQFGRRFRFEGRDVNFFSPLVRKNGEWRSPALTAGKVTLGSNGSLRCRASYAGLSVTRQVTAGARTVFHDVVRLAPNVGWESIRLVSVPLIVEGSSLKLTESGVEVRRGTQVVELMIRADVSLRLSLEERFDYVGGAVVVVAGVCSQAEVSRKVHIEIVIGIRHT